MIALVSFGTINAVSEGYHTAETLLNKYKGVDKSGKIFPFISSQKYNDAIKEIFKVLDALTEGARCSIMECLGTKDSKVIQNRQ